MIEFPASTKIHRKIPKEAFYKNLTLTPALKSKFVSDVSSIYVENSLSNDSLNLRGENNAGEILLLLVNLKKSEFDAKIIEAIARQNPHKLIFLLAHEDRRQLAIYHSKLYRTDWEPGDSIKLSANGFTLDEIWDSLIEQIALREERVQESGDLLIDERLALQDKVLKLEKQIERLEVAAWKEQQPKKRFALYTELKRRKRELEKVMVGE